MIKLWKVALVAAVFSLTGCASSLMKPATNQALAAPSAQSSRIVFLRPSSLGGAIQASLFDVSADQPRFIGVSSTKTKVVYDVPAGTRRLMVTSEAADFMEAKLAPGKTYYAVVTPRLGAWKARFSLWPVKAQSANEFNFQNPDFANWVKSGQVVENTPAGQQWFTANEADIRKKQAEYLVVWKQKTPQEIAERTLEEQDGRSE
jgi:hypothetical protein